MAGSFNWSTMEHMNIYIRRLLLFVSYTAFVIIAPLIVLYAIGYRPQTSSPIPRPVGVILADAAPRRASIAVDGVEYGTLPRSVSNIEPGMAHVRITKEGYTPWEKQLEVKPTQATDVRSIQLLPTNFQRETLAEHTRLFAVSPNNLLIAVATIQNTLSILDDTGTRILPDEQLLERPTSIAWSPDGTYLLVSFPKNTSQLFQVSEVAIIKVSAKDIAGLTNILWSPLAANTIYGLDKARSIVSYTIPTATKEVLVKNVNTYDIANRTIYYQTFQNELVAQQLRSRDIRVLTPDTGKKIKKISAASSGTLALLFADGELSIQKMNGDTVKISPVAETALWSPDGQLLLVQTTPTELNIYNVENERLFAIPQGELRLITRLSQPITYPQWFSDSLHIFYQTSNTIFFSEIDTRDHAIALPIGTVRPGANITIGDQSESILYLQEEGANTLLVKTWLVTKEDR